MSEHCRLKITKKKSVQIVENVDVKNDPEFNSEILKELSCLIKFKCGAEMNKRDMPSSAKEALLAG